MSDIEIRQQHAIRHQLQAIRLGAVYGALALAGLIALHIASGATLGALLAIGSAFLAYLNFTIVSVNPESAWIGRTQMLSILSGAASAALALSGAVL